MTRVRIVVTAAAVTGGALSGVVHAYPAFDPSPVGLAVAVAWGALVGALGTWCGTVVLGLLVDPLVAAWVAMLRMASSTGRLEPVGWVEPDTSEDLTVAEVVAFARQEADR